jgi:hypothetical protein
VTGREEGGMQGGAKARAHESETESAARAGSEEEVSQADR